MEFCFRAHHSPLEGESARRGRKPDVAPVGGSSGAPAAPPRPGEPQGPHRLPLKGGAMGRIWPQACPWLEQGQKSALHGGVGIVSPRLRNGEPRPGAGAGRPPPRPQSEGGRQSGDDCVSFVAHFAHGFRAPRAGVEPRARRHGKARPRKRQPLCTAAFSGSCASCPNNSRSALSSFSSAVRPQRRLMRTQ